ncbi:MAG: DUF3187 family protein [Gammaproteobacteria bacterium]|jgi:hypothetical protein
MGNRRILATGLLFILILAGRAHAADFYGPLRIRDMTPFSLLRMDFLPPHGVTNVDSGWALEMHLSESNTFVLSDNVLSYLQQRGRRDRLTMADVRYLDAMLGDFYYFDGEIGLLNTTAHYAFDRHWMGYVTIPIVWYQGGFMDSPIEAFHGAAGLGQMGRDLVARNNFQTVMRINGASFALLSPPVAAGFGDPTFGLRYSADHAIGNWDLISEAAYKPAIASAPHYFSSGKPDIGMQFSLQRKYVADALYASGSMIHVGGSELFPTATRTWVPSFTFAWEHALEGSTSVVSQLTWARSMFTSSQLEGLAADEFQASLGIRQSVNHVVWSFAFTENIKNFENTADFGFHVGAAWLFTDRG